MADDANAQAERLMEDMGFTAEDRGPFVTALFDLMRRKAADGCAYVSPGSWAPGSMPSAEERARSYLAFEWAVEHGQCHKVECLDPIWSWQTDFRTMKRRLRVRWRCIPARLRDRCREGAFLLRRWWMIDVLKLRNPYEA